MANVNPPPIKVPAAVRRLNPELFAYLDELAFMIFQLWERTGGGSDIIENITNSETFENSFTAGESHERIDSVEQIEDWIPIQVEKSYNILTVGGNYTAINGDQIEAITKANITLDSNAIIGDTVRVSNADGSNVQVTGSIALNKIHSAVEITRQGSSYLFEKYDSYWRIV